MTELGQRIRQHEYGSAAIEAELTTDERVLARITDGIYRRPVSALRELVANAYDADAFTVSVTTDSPRFSEIRVQDDGIGMSPETLANVVEHIGGSAKRTKLGHKFGITGEDVTRSKSLNRRLIGKIGIGLFSVAQLTRSFQIVTKQKDTDFRLVADVVLNAYSEEQLKNLGDEEQTSFSTGSVRIWRVPAVDVEAHGTDIILRDIQPRVRDALQSRSVWLSSSEASGKAAARALPVYHIGLLGSNGQVAEPRNVPWDDGDSPRKKFRKLVDAVVVKEHRDRGNPKLTNILDEYLQTVWELSLAVPLDYVAKHPFDFDGADPVLCYKASNQSGGQATLVKLAEGTSVREELGLNTGAESSAFRVIFDGIELSRPQDILSMPATAHSLDKKIMVFGHRSFDLRGAETTVTGGARLAFEGYLAWTPRVVPQEHNGILVRIHGATGTLFDSTLMHWQVAENRRKKQLTGEVFVSAGLEAALNIDRESFNVAHPHYQLLSKWVHSLIRQLVNRQKEVAKSARQRRLAEQSAQQATAVRSTGDRLVAEALSMRDFDEEQFEEPVFSDGTDQPNRIDLETPLNEIRQAKGRRTAAFERLLLTRQAQAEQIFRLLAALELLNDVSRDDCGYLARGIVSILSAEDQA